YLCGIRNRSEFCNHQERAAAAPRTSPHTVVFEPDVGRRHFQKRTRSVVIKASGSAKTYSRVDARNPSAKPRLECARRTRADRSLEGVLSVRPQLPFLRMWTGGFCLRTSGSKGTGRRAYSSLFGIRARGSKDTRRATRSDYARILRMNEIRLRMRIS